MAPDGTLARWLDRIQIDLDASPSPRRYAALRIARYVLARQIPAFYPAPTTLRHPVQADRRAA
jgi:hypothetical protein